jgi:hypothetical protein
MEIRGEMGMQTIAEGGLVLSRLTAKLLGIDLVEHTIVGKDHGVSLKQQE